MQASKNFIKIVEFLSIYFDFLLETAAISNETQSNFSDIYLEIPLYNEVIKLVMFFINSL